MTNLTKAIAVLGVVAGLGVAALPLSSYAVTVIDGEAPESGAVEGATYDGVKDGTVKTDVGVKLVVEDALTISADKDTTDNMVDITNGAAAVKVTVVTNNQTGYNLNLKGTTTNGTATALINENKVEIAAMSAPFTAPVALSTTASEWGYSVANTNANLSDDAKAAIAKFTEGVYAGVDGTSGAQIVDVTKPTGEDGDTTTVTFAAKVADDQPAGTYKGQVTFTATNNVIATE